METDDLPGTAITSPASGPAIPEEALLPTGLVGALVRAAGNEAKGVTFIQDEDAPFVLYSELLRRAMRRASGLSRAGLAKGDLLILQCRENLEFVLTFWGAILAGVIPVPLAFANGDGGPTDLTQKLQRVWESVERPPIVADAALASSAAANQVLLGDAPPPRILACHELEDRDASDVGDMLDRPRLDDIAFIQFSSGSTGQPKGVVLTHRNLLANLYAIELGLSLTPDDSAASWMPYHHDMGLIGFHLTPIMAQMSQVNMAPTRFLRRPLQWLRMLCDHNVTVSGAPNFGYQLILDKLEGSPVTELDLRCVRLLLNGAEPISCATMAQFAARLAPYGLSPTAMFPVYGMAEASLAVTFPTPGDLPRVFKANRQRMASEGVVTLMPQVTPEDASIALAGVGRPVAGCSVRVVDHEGGVVRDGTVGRIQIRGTNVTSGYYRLPTVNEVAFQEGWLNTGDLGAFVDGSLVITGREKDIIFVRGRNYYAFDIEQCAATVDEVALHQLAASAWNDDRLGRDVVVLFVAAKGTDGERRNALAIRIWQRVAERTGVLLDHVVLVRRIPKTTSGKVQRQALAGQFSRGELQGARIVSAEEILAEIGQMEASSTESTNTERRVQQRWGVVLGRSVDQIPFDASFLGLGGSSLKAIQLLSELEVEFSTSFSHELLLRCKTVREIAKYVDAHLASAKGPAEETVQFAAPTSALEPEIAIVAMDARLPGVRSLDEFWHVLASGNSLVTDVPPGRWPGLPTPGRARRRGAFLERPFDFDARFFKMGDDEVASMDPQQRLVLELSWNALDNAGYSGERADGAKIGFFLGASHNGFMEYLLHSLTFAELERFEAFQKLAVDQRDRLAEEWRTHFGDVTFHPNTAANNLLNMIAARVAHAFNLKGPSMAIDTACSSSLVAVHLACESLRRGECDMALSGGVNLLLTETPHILFANAGALSPTGVCKVFDAAADGFVPGEGAAILVLKRLDDALRDSDRILAVIKGSAINSDGRSLGIMAPNPDGQREAIEAVYRTTGVDPSSVSYVEAHGTGTAIGDPSEIRALSAAFGKFTERRGFCGVGSVKANVGHLLCAAGAAGLVKLVLSLGRGQLAPCAGLERLNPLIRFEETAFYPVRECRPWERQGDMPRRAAINSFGFGGTNCHMLLEEAPERPVSGASESSRYRVMGVSAHSEAALLERCSSLAAYLDAHPEVSEHDVCFTVNAHRATLNRRMGIAAESRTALVAKLRSASAKSVVTCDAPARVALLFTGQGAQYPGMTRLLYEQRADYRRYFDEAGAHFEEITGKPMAEFLFANETTDETLSATVVTQAVMFTVDYAIGKLLLEWGLRPACMFGHSVGEYVAACLSGMVGLEDCTRVLKARAKGMQSLPQNGGMAAVFASPAEVQKHLEAYRGHLWVAGYNGSNQVVSGELAALDEFTERAQAAGITSRKLSVSHAFHSPLMEPMLDDFRRVVATVKFHAPTIPVISNVSASWFDQAPDADYWVSHILSPVHFEPSVRRALDAKVTAFVEAGPDRILSNLVRSIVDSQTPVRMLAPILRKQPNDQTVAQTLAGLFEVGAKLDWDRIEADPSRCMVGLPSYPFQRQSYAPRALASVDSPGAVDGLLYRWEWTPMEEVTRTALPKGAILCVCHDPAMAVALEARLSANDGPVYCVLAGHAFAREGTRRFTVQTESRADLEHVIEAVRAETSQPVRAAVYLGDSRATIDEVPSRVWGVIALAQAMARQAEHGGEAPMLLVVTHKGHKAEGDEGSAMALAAAARALAFEKPAFDARVLEISGRAYDNDILARAIVDEMGRAPSAERLVSVRDRVLLSRCLVPVGSTRSSPAIGLGAGDTVLITGGASGVGAEIATDLVRRFGVRLVLTGRRALPPRETWDDLANNGPDAARVAVIRRIEALSGNVMYRAVDVTDRRGMQALVDEASQGGPITGVIHAAGDVDRATPRLVDKTLESISRVMRPKVKGTAIVDAVTRGCPLRFFALFASMAASEARWGGGLVDYAAANAFEDGYAEWRNNDSAPGKSLAINWSLWDGCGMGADIGLAALVRAKGIRPLSIGRALRCFYEALTVGGAVVHVLDRDGDATAPLPQPWQVAKTPPSGTVLHVEHRTETAAQLVTGVLAKALRIPEGEIELSRNFLELGLDSHGAVAVAAGLGQRLGRVFNPTILFEFQTPSDLIRFLERELVASSVPAAKKTVMGAIELGATATVEPIVADEDGIAIIGMSCNFPGARGLGAYWNLLQSGTTMIREVRDRDFLARYFDTDEASAHASYSKWGGAIDDPFGFDAMFFGISPREAAAMDPQQRLFLEVAWEALQQAGYASERPRDTSVFVGCEVNHYAERFVTYQRFEALRQRFAREPWFLSLSPEGRSACMTALVETLQPSKVVSDVVAGSGLNEIAARVSHTLNLHGPSLAVNTACSSALVALHLACVSLRSGESSMAIVGGAYLNLGSTPFVFLSKLKALSPDGRCLPFDHKANGMVLGEGVGAVVLKPYRKAVADGDFVWAVIKGSAVNNDGHSQGITVPSSAGQADVIQRAYQNARLDPATVSYVECHGTGTSLGDPIEIQGLVKAFRASTQATQFCGIGSAKSNLGHMLAASGIASVIKVAMAMRHEVLPPTAGFEEPNPHIDFADSPFFVVRGDSRPWHRNGSPRRGGINAFGFGGTNAHVILEESTHVPRVPSGTGPFLVVLSGRTEATVRRAAIELRDHLLREPESAIGSVCLSTNLGQRSMAQRVATRVDDLPSLVDRLGELASGSPHDATRIGRVNPGRPPSVDLYFGVLESIDPGTVTSLCRRFWPFDQAYERAVTLARRQAIDISSVRFQRFIAGYALGKLLHAVGITPRNVYAEQEGVLPAAALSGALSLESCLSMAVGSDIPAESSNLPPEQAVGCWASTLTIPGARIERAGEGKHAAACRSASVQSLAAHEMNGPSVDTACRLVLGRWSVPLVGSSDAVHLGESVSADAVLEALAMLYVGGVSLKHAALFDPGTARVPLPTYPFERSQFVAGVPEIEVPQVQSPPEAHKERALAPVAVCSRGLERAEGLPSLDEHARRATHARLCGFLRPRPQLSE